MKHSGRLVRHWDRSPPSSRWSGRARSGGANHLYDFLNALPARKLLAVEQALGLLGRDDGVAELKGKSRDVRDIQARALRCSNSVFTRQGKDPAAPDDHELVSWVAREAGVNPKVVSEASAFASEREVNKQLFARLWDKLSDGQRVELLDRIDPSRSLKDHAGVALMTGAGALGALSTTVSLAGFAFYTTMSVTLCAVGGYFGLTFPFAVYRAASSLVAFLCGPVGWALMGVAAAGGLALAGRASYRESSAFVLQAHALKVAALVAVEAADAVVFIT